jgi:hypothetical protein
MVDATVGCSIRAVAIAAGGSAVPRAHFQKLDSDIQQWPLARGFAESP